MCILILGTFGCAASAWSLNKYRASVRTFEGLIKGSTFLVQMYAYQRYSLVLRMHGVYLL